jgi:hypothetical protein
VSFMLKKQSLGFIYHLNCFLILNLFIFIFMFYTF